MEPFLISPEAEEQFNTWMAAFNPDSSSLLACNDPDIRKTLIEQVINSFPNPTHKHILLDLRETRVSNLADDLLRKVGDPQDFIPGTMIHVINLEHSLLESAAGDGYAEEWAKDMINGFPYPVHLYGDERLLASLDGQSWAGAVSPASLIEGGEPRLPYEKISTLSGSESLEPYQIADLLAMSGALAHAEHWYLQQEEIGEYQLETEIGLGEIEAHRQHLDLAAEHFSTAESLIDASSNSDLLARLSLGKGRLAFAGRDWKAAIKDLSASLSQLSQEESREEIGEINRMIGRAWEQKGEPDKAITAYLNAARTWSEEAGFAMAAAKAFQHAGAICQGQFRFEEAREHFSSALPLAVSAGDPFLEASLEDSIEAMSEKVAKKKKKGGKGLFGKLFS